MKEKQIKIPFLPIHLFSGAVPTDYVYVFKSGELRKYGKGINAWVGPKSSVLIIPGVNLKKAFQYKIVSSDNQDFTVAGEITYSIKPEARDTYDFSVDLDDGMPLTDAIQQAGESTVNRLRPHFLKFGAGKDIKALNGARHELEQEIQKVVSTINTSTDVVQIIQVAISTAQAEAKISQALQATIAEQLLAESDKATADRQKAAENNRRDQLLQQVATDISHQTARTEAIEKKLENDKKEATAFGENEKLKLEPFRGMGPGLVLAHALRTNNHIGSITITTEVLASMLASRENG